MEGCRLFLQEDSKKESRGKKRLTPNEVSLNDRVNISGNYFARYSRICFSMPGPSISSIWCSSA